MSLINLKEKIKDEVFVDCFLKNVRYFS